MSKAKYCRIWDCYLDVLFIFITYSEPRPAARNIQIDPETFPFFQASPVMTPLRHWPVKQCLGVRTFGHWHTRGDWRPSQCRILVDRDNYPVSRKWNQPGLILRRLLTDGTIRSELNDLFWDWLYSISFQNNKCAEICCITLLPEVWCLWLRQFSVFEMLFSTKCTRHQSNFESLNNKFLSHLKPRKEEQNCVKCVKTFHRKNVIKLALTPPQSPDSKRFQLETDQLSLLCNL